jgi:GntR family transcriptional regulator, transcriptional repressor for pyruvate dehydrogenase complex
LAIAKTAEFEAIRRNRLYEEVARRMERLILGDCKPGDKLPPERQLAEMFGVSRSSIRDAIRTLELAGMVERRQGAGTVAREPSADSVITPISSVLMRKRRSVAELLDVRKMIEPPLAARAALHATSDEIFEMEEILRRQEEKVRRGELAIEEDSEFHYAIAMAADNTVVLQVLDVLMDLLRETRQRSLQAEGRLQKSFAGHQQILAALKRRDATAAEQAMRRHVQDIEEIVLKKL